MITADSEDDKLKAFAQIGGEIAGEMGGSTGVQDLNSALKGLNEAAQDVAELNVARNAGWGNSSRKARDRE